MARWTVREFADLCRAVLANGYEVQTVDAYLCDPASKVVVMRHDVDRFPANALAMARVEHQLGICSTYYFRTIPSVFKPDTIESIRDLGHEVGYHYEVLAKAGGDMERALDLFATELAGLRRLAPVRTAAAHGSPLSSWDSLEIWQHAAPGDFGLRGEPYLDFDYERLAYYTDTGRTWNANRTNLRDRAPGEASRLVDVATTDELRDLLRSSRCPRLCLQTHPERWNSSATGLIRSLALDGAANAIKLVLRAAGRGRGQTLEHL